MPADELAIRDPLTRFQFNAACALVYQEFENKRQAEQLKVQLQGIAVILGADPKNFKDAAEDADDDDVL